MTREDLLARTFVQLADAYVDDVDLVHVSQMVARRCIELFAVSAAGVLLSDDGRLRVASSSNDRVRRVQLYECQIGEGPGSDCYRTGQPVLVPTLARSRDRWPRFAPIGLAAGFGSVHAVPVAVPDRVIGSLNLFGHDVGALAGPDLLAARALAQAMAFTVLRTRPSRPAGSIIGELRPALDDRLVVEQAKGVLAGRAGVGIDEARQRIERYAHHHDLELTSVCREIVAGTLSLVTLPENSALHRKSQ